MPPHLDRKLIKLKVERITELPVFSVLIIEVESFLLLLD